MRPHRRMTPLRTLFALFALLAFAAVAAAQTTAPPTPPKPVCSPGPTPSKNDPVTPESVGGIRIAVTGPDGQPLQRKRFYLLERDVTKDSNFNPASAPKRDDFLAGASTELRAWLKKYDCDSLYCPEYEAAYEEAVKTVPEFKAAHAEGMKKYKNPKLAMRWVTVNFPLKNVRTEYYNRKKAWLAQAAVKGGPVASVMTDEKGVAYFRDVKLRTYYVSNLIPLEDGNVLWNCEVAVPPPIPRQLYSVSFTLTAPKTAPK